MAVSVLRSSPVRTAVQLDVVASPKAPRTGRPPSVYKSVPPTKCKPVSRDRAVVRASSSIHYNVCALLSAAGPHKLARGSTPVVQTEFLMTGVRA